MMEKINKHLIENGNIYIVLTLVATGLSFAIWFIYDTVVNGL